jgi:hypothetical protein
LEELGQPLPLGGRQVFLVLELLLQFDGLVVGEADLTPLPLVQGALEDGRAPDEVRRRFGDQRTWGNMDLKVNGKLGETDFLIRQMLLMLLMLLMMFLMLLMLLMLLSLLMLML